MSVETVSYTHLRAHETVLDLVCRLLLVKKQTPNAHNTFHRLTLKLSIDIPAILYRTTLVHKT